MCPLLSDLEMGGEKMSSLMEVDAKVRDKARAKVMEAVEMLNQEGVDGTQAVMEMMSSTGDPMGEKEMAGDDDMERKKAMIIIALKKKNGEAA